MPAANTAPKGRIALFFLYDSLEALPFMRDGLAMLVEAGYSPEVYSSVPLAPAPAPEGVSMLGHSEAFLFFTGGYPRLLQQLRRGGRLYEWLAMNLSRPVRRTFFHRFLRQRHAELPYAGLIGCDAEALVSAAPLVKMLGVPLVYWSLELLFRAETTTLKQKKLKELEIAASRAAGFTIIQDHWRAAALAAENGLAAEQFIYVPNAPRGPARRQPSNYLHTRLGIDPRRKVILCPGLLGPWTMSAELAQVAAAWPTEWVLVLQSPHPRAHYWEQAYLDKLLHLADPAHVVISFEPVPLADYRAMMDSAMVGLALYAPMTSPSVTQGRNVALMGLSSGKLAGFLHSGLPVVVNSVVTGPKELVEAAGCGLCVSGPEQIRPALETIFRAYDTYSTNAVRCFNQELELGARFEKVLARLDRLA